MKVIHLNRAKIQQDRKVDELADQLRSRLRAQARRRVQQYLQPNEPIQRTTYGTTHETI